MSPRVSTILLLPPSFCYRQELNLIELLVWRVNKIRFIYSTYTRINYTSSSSTILLSPSFCYRQELNLIELFVWWINSTYARINFIFDDSSSSPFLLYPRQGSNLIELFVWQVNKIRFIYSTYTGINYISSLLPSLLLLLLPPPFCCIQGKDQILSNCLTSG